MANGPNGETKGIQASVLDSLRWRLVGPHRGGRVVAVAGDVSDPMTFYHGACAGGVWKTTDGGTYWRNVSDGYFTSAAVGAIAVSQSDPNVIYVGTGEASIRGNVVHGDGVYKSTDAGKTWKNVGLRDTRHIGRIQIHPDNPDIVYVAALGHAWGRSEERGVFRSTDGGETWQKVLYKSDHAGSHDVSLDPNNPDVLFAAIWQVQRYPHTLISGGEESGLWRSTDGGDTWEDITRKPGLPTGILGKIGVVVSPARRDRVWALIEAEDGAVFRSDDGGETWDRLSEESLLRTRPWYYMHITADTQDPDTVYIQNYSFWKSIDAGASFSRIPTPHGDDHALWIDPYDNQRMIEGNDGGACVSFNGGASWSSIYNQPTAQLYHVTTDDRVPYRIYGSQQDNTALSIPSRVVNGAIHERDWFAPGGGESGYIAVKPDDPEIVVASGPAGRRNYNDIMTTYDGRTGQKWNTTVWPELYGWGVGAVDLKYRFQWTFPIMFSRHDPNVLYVSGNRLFKSTNLGASWEAVSPDLTRNDPSRLQASGGPITRDNTGAEVYGTIFALAESPHQAGLIWAGTDDGLLHISENGGRNWDNITPPDLPEWALISIIEPSPHDPATAYVAATRYKSDDPTPYLYKTNDFGSSWTLITKGIPENDFTRVVREDPNRRGLLYAGTESGIYVSFNDGEQWERLGGNFPVVPVHDFVIKGVELVVASHGRSFWILDDLTPLHQLKDGIDADGAHLFQPRPTMRFRTYGSWRQDPPIGLVSYSRVDTSLYSKIVERAPDGSTVETLLDAGQNPPDGVVIQYYLERESSGPISLRILDAGGNELRSFSSEAGDLTARAGVNRFLWSMRAAGAESVRPQDADLGTWDRPEGPVVLPGTYQAVLSVDGREQTQTFEIEPDPRLTVTREDLQAQYDFLIEIRDALTRNNHTLNTIEAILPQLRSWERRTAGDAKTEAIHGETRKLIGELEAVRGELIDVNIKQAQLWPSGLHEKLNALFNSVDSADYAPPQQARDVFAQLTAQLDGLVARTNAATGEQAAALSARIVEAGLPVIGVAG